MRRLLTEPTALTTEFWKAAADRRLVLPRCRETRRYFFPPEVCVPGTASTDWSYEPASGRGTVESFSVVHRPVSADFEAPYVLAIVALDEGVAMLTNIVGCDVESVTIGMPVEVTFVDVEGGTLPLFQPAAG